MLHFLDTRVEADVNILWFAQCHTADDSGEFGDHDLVFKLMDNLGRFQRFARMQLRVFFTTSHVPLPAGLLCPP